MQLSKIPLQIHKEIICRKLSLGLVTKARACKGVGKERSPRVTSHVPEKCRWVWRNEPSHSQGSSHFGSWSLGGLPNFQRAIAGVKTHWIEALLIWLKRSWNVDVWNGLAWPIWTPKTQVMAKRRVGSRNDNLTPIH
jgi:hypothetical protein